jgi:hypothetical protein
MHVFYELQIILMFSQDGVTPLLLARMEDKRKIANFLLKMNIREMDNMAKYSC